MFEGQYEEKFPEVSKESQMYAADWYFGQLIAYEAQVEAEEVFAWFEESHKHILNHMVTPTLLMEIFIFIRKFWN